MSEVDLKDLVDVSEVAEAENSEMIDMFSEEEIKRQIELFNKLNGQEEQVEVDESNRSRLVIWLRGSKGKIQIQSEEFDSEMAAVVKYNSLVYCSKIMTLGSKIEK